MAPRTRNISKRTVVPTMKKLLEPDCADTVFNFETNEFPMKLELSFSDFFEKIDELVAGVAEKLGPSIDVRNALNTFFEGILRPVPTCPIKLLDQASGQKVQTPQNDTLNLLETSISCTEPQKEVLMDVDEDSNRTYDIFGVRSETLTSSEDDLDTTAISEATTQLEEMSLNDDLIMTTPLHTSTPLKSEDVSSESEASISVISPPRMIVREPPSSKSEHANSLRSKFLMTKREKLREENEKKAANVLEQNRLLEQKEGFSRHGASLKRTEAFTPSSRATKKTRVHLFSKEDKPPKFNEVLITCHKPETSTNSIKKSRAKNNEKSCQVTPERKNYSADYGIDDLHSGGETDDESDPRKPIPKWAHSDRVKKNVRKQIENPPFDVDKFFGTVEKPDLREIFGHSH